MLVGSTSYTVWRVRCITWLQRLLKKEVFGDPADVWAIGVCVYHLLCGTVPFDGKTIDACRVAIERHDVKFPARLGWAQRSRECRDFIRFLLVRDPAARPSAAAALDDLWAASDKSRGLTRSEKSQSVSGLRGFTEAPAFVKATLLLAAVQLSPEELEPVERLFGALDLDQDGFVTPEDLREAFCQPSEASPVVARRHAVRLATEQSLRSLSFSYTGSPTFFHSRVSSSGAPENVSNLSRWSGEDGARLLSDLVGMADMNGNGALDFSEFVASCLHARLVQCKQNPEGRKEAKEVLQRAFDCYDFDQNGVVTRSEVHRLLDNNNAKSAERAMGVDYKDVLRGMPEAFSLDIDAFVEVVLTNTGPIVSIPGSQSDIAADEEFEHGILDDSDSIFWSRVEEDKNRSKRWWSSNLSTQVSRLAARAGTSSCSVQ
mmetsp:Transcript_84408/g.192398  ORF Transcript_84408/g.192398 Transcript_84408/m.192398 type:complete len:431 (-) Transcript_84408:8-1300(-)